MGSKGERGCDVAIKQGINKALSHKCWDVNQSDGRVASGKQPHNYGKSPCY